MATLNVGSPGGRRQLNHDIPLIPFIDFLLCLVSFLLITAVWSQMARINADAQVPGKHGAVTPEQEEKVLHVEIREGRAFQLAWRQGQTVLETIEVPAQPERLGSGQVRYPALSKRIDELWQRNEARHYHAADPSPNRAVLHASDATEFAELIAVMDAMNTPQRQWKNASGEVTNRPAFDVAFAIN